MKYYKILFACIASLFAYVSNAQVKVYPSNWWAGMKTTNLQLMFHGNNIGDAAVTTTYPGIILKKLHKAESRNYLFLDIVLSPNIKTGTATFTLKTNGTSQTVSFPIDKKREGRGKTFAQGVRSEDFIYLLMPDRFSNGDESNDRVAGMRDQTLNRDSVYHRHGGDLQGVINHLDYLQDLGVTTVWMTPVLENDMPNRTEHGYAITNHYTVEKRFGGEEAYKKLSDALHARGMKLIQDAVYNHVGKFHFTVQDLPMKDWLNQWPKYTNTTYKDQAVFDPYGAKQDRDLLVNGWFTPMMPDMNHANPFVANYLIQNAIWCVEELGVDGWRIDTYIYNDLEFMNRCNAALLNEYPAITMFGETWVHGVVNQAYFVKNKMNTPFKSNLIGVTDFQTNLYGIAPAMNQKFGWTEGVNKLYTTLSNDFVYDDPMNNVNFLDNHDLTRFITQVNNDQQKLKTALAWLLTVRGIPQMYYGTEILMKGSTHPSDGFVRLDFKGGWKNDAENKFTKEGRTADENEMHDYVRTLARFRQTSSALKKGKMMQYVPKDGLYVYFRYDNNETVMCVMNTDEKERKVALKDFSERTAGFKKIHNVITGKEAATPDNIIVPSYSMTVLQLIK
jgi:neopullulanase